jgi:hypothetical protein
MDTRNQNTVKQKLTIWMKGLFKLFHRRVVIDDSLPSSEVTVRVEKPAPSQNANRPAFRQDQSTGQSTIGTSKLAAVCPYCGTKDFVKRGLRKKKYELVQLYLCHNQECGKTFTAQSVKGKRYPLNVILEGLSYYNLGLTLEATCAVLQQKFGASPETATLSSWLAEYKELCRYERLRPFGVKMYNPREVVEVTTLAHRQLYRFRYHRAKMRLLLNEFKHSRFRPLKDYLDNVTSETPHQYFQDGMRMSEVKTKFDKADMIVKGKNNYANSLAALVLQAVKENKDRHEAVQRFMLANDSVTVATEVPVYIRSEDIEYMENELNFKILDGLPVEVKSRKSRPDGLTTESGLPRLLTGHIDLVQVRNRQIHVLDFKPNAAKEKPIEQLTWYALALSRLTGLRLFEFKCAWFDEKDYFEFYPLHVVKKLGPTKKPRKVRYRDGSTAVIPEKNELIVV